MYLKVTLRRVPLNPRLRTSVIPECIVGLWASLWKRNNQQSERHPKSLSRNLLAQHLSTLMLRLSKGPMPEIRHPDSRTNLIDLSPWTAPQTNVSVYRALILLGTPPSLIRVRFLGLRGEACLLDGDTRIWRFLRVSHYYGRGMYIMYVCGESSQTEPFITLNSNP